jgi:GTP-binding protein
VKKQPIVPERARPAHRPDRPARTAAATAGTDGISATNAAPEGVAQDADAPHPLIGATFVIGAASPAQLPAAGPPEVAFAGRSNAGKSSAINALANRTRLAFASRTPGRTQQINIFALRNSPALVADLPGYGYAAVARSIKRSWQAFLWP